MTTGMTPADKQTWVSKHSKLALQFRMGSAGVRKNKTKQTQRACLTDHGAESAVPQVQESPSTPAGGGDSLTPSTKQTPYSKRMSLKSETAKQAIRANRAEGMRRRRRILRDKRTADRHLMSLTVTEFGSPKELELLRGSTKGVCGLCASQYEESTVRTYHGLCLCRLCMEDLTKSL